MYKACRKQHYNYENVYAKYKDIEGENTGNITGVNGKTFGWCRSISLLRKKLGV
jgi:hypothetical protein